MADGGWKASQPAPRAKIIVNPVAGARSTRRQWPKISRLLSHVGLSFDFQFTEGVGHAIELAHAAAGDGYRYVVAVGGDGTIHEVANGILSSGGAAETTMGIISTGTGSDFVRSLGVSRDYVPACSALVHPQRSRIDVGVVEYHNHGSKHRRFFVNAAGMGFDAAVTESTERLPKYFGGTIPYVFGLLRTITGYRNKMVELRNGDKTEKLRIVMVAVANGRYYGGGMRVAPRADLRDGQLDLVVVRDMGKIALLRAFPSIYQGKHVTHPKVTISQTTAITVDTSERVFVQADGEMVGEGPASFRVLPSALNVAV
jgi:diacylglycerol kinase (ATP)